MNGYSDVTLLGNLTRDSEVRQLPSGKSVANFSLAINNSWRTADGEKKEEVFFVDVEAWAGTADIVSKYTGKGAPLFVKGRLRVDTWDDKQSGQKRSRMKVVAEEVRLIGGRKDGESGGGVSRARSDEFRTPSQQKQNPSSFSDDPGDDDIPF